MVVALNKVDALSDDPALTRLRERRDASVLGGALRAVSRRYPELPLPGRGQTIERWRVLQDIAASDLVLAKLTEPHWDAQAILADCFDGGEPAAFAAVSALSASQDERRANAGLWAVWAAEPPDARVTGHHGRDSLLLTGRKAWCSGAGLASHALVTYWDEQGRSCLAAVALDAPGVSVTSQGWHAVGMDATVSTDVHFEATPAVMIGEPGHYLSRPGFWHGGMGIAACWLGGCVALARRVAAAQAHPADLPRSVKVDSHAQAHLGAIDVALSQAQALMRETAQWVDRYPHADPTVAAIRMRGAAEACATAVLWHAGRALGAGPMCREPATARLFADLPVFIRQSHAERDLASLGAAVDLSECPSWVL